MNEQRIDVLGIIDAQIDRAAKVKADIAAYPSEAVAEAKRVASIYTPSGTLAHLEKTLQELRNPI